MNGGPAAGVSPICVYRGTVALSSAAVTRMSWMVAAPKMSATPRAALQTISTAGAPEQLPNASQGCSVSRRIPIDLKARCRDVLSPRQRALAHPPYRGGSVEASVSRSCGQPPSLGMPLRCATEIREESAPSRQEHERRLETTGMDGRRLIRIHAGHKGFPAMMRSDEQTRWQESKMFQPEADRLREDPPSSTLEDLVAAASRARSRLEALDGERPPQADPQRGARCPRSAGSVAGPATGCRSSCSSRTRTRDAARLPRCRAIPPEHLRRAGARLRDVGPPSSVAAGRRRDADVARRVPEWSGSGR